MIDPKSFVVANERGLHKGQRVRTRHGPGVIELIWFGCEENAIVILDNGTQRDCGLEMDDVWPETKEPEMNLLETYDALKPQPPDKVRRIGRGDVLEGNDSNRYLIIGTDTWVQRVRISTGTVEGSPMYARDTDALDRAAAVELCGGYLAHFRLVGRAKDVVTINDPGE